MRQGVSEEEVTPQEEEEALTITSADVIAFLEQLPPNEIVGMDCWWKCAVARAVQHKYGRKYVYVGYQTFSAWDDLSYAPGERPEYALPDDLKRFIKKWTPIAQHHRKHYGIRAETLLRDLRRYQEQGA